MGVFDKTYTYPIKNSSGSMVSSLEPIEQGGSYTCKGAEAATFFIDGVAYKMAPGTNWAG